MGPRAKAGSPSRREIVIYVLGAIGFVVWLLIIARRPAPLSGSADPEILRAEEIMDEAVAALGRCRAEAGPPIDPAVDVNRTGLIGLEISPITTSLGQLEAKRTTANPQMAGAVVRMFREAGARRGSTVAVGASSSFPGLMVATLAAARAAGLRPLVILSLGASNWGANDPRWTGLDILGCLRREGVLDVRPIALSVGGEGDDGRDMPAEGRELLRRKIAASGIPAIEETGLEADVAARLRLFEGAAAGAPLAAFVNVGGSWVDMGTDSRVLKLRPGYNPSAGVEIPPPPRRGLIQEMAGRGVPVLHLLYVKGLCERYGLPWDPVPLPKPGGQESRRASM